MRRAGIAASGARKKDGNPVGPEFLWKQATRHKKFSAPCGSAAPDRTCGVEVAGVARCEVMRGFREDNKQDCCSGRANPRYAGWTRRATVAVAGGDSTVIGSGIDHCEGSKAVGQQTHGVGARRVSGATVSRAIWARFVAACVSADVVSLRYRINAAAGLSGSHMRVTLGLRARVIFPGCLG